MLRELRTSVLKILASDEEFAARHLGPRASGPHRRLLWGRDARGPSTIETYRAHIKEKLNLRTGTELIRAAVQWVTERHAP